jgi:cyclopropane fatty-acyl-phospholipid synthase-like methyltransferase
VLSLVVGHLERHPEGVLLDVGPVCGDNIAFFASLVKKLYIHDLLRQLGQERQKDSADRRIWQDFCYPSETFDAVQTWNLCDHLDDRDFTSFIELCASMMKPKGLLMLVAASETRHPTSLNLFAIEKGLRLQVRPLSNAGPPFYHRHNRDLLDLMKPLRFVKSFIYQNGFREFLFEHP